MRIYIVYATFGSWDGYHERSLKAFIDKEFAERYSEKYTRIFKGLKKFHDDCNTYIQSIEDKKLEIEDEEEYKKAEKECEDMWNNDYRVKLWSKYTSGVGEFNETKIKELELNTKTVRGSKLKRILNEDS